MTLEDRENSAFLKQNRFIGFNYDCTDSVDSNSPGGKKSDIAFSPVSNAQRKSLINKQMSEDLDNDIDEFAEGETLGNTSPVRLFKNRTKLTRENIATIKIFNFSSIAKKYE
jgi:hypothetical protein